MLVEVARSGIKKNTTKIKANTIGYYAIIGNSLEGFLNNSNLNSDNLGNNY